MIELAENNKLLKKYKNSVDNYLDLLAVPAFVIDPEGNIRKNKAFGVIAESYFNEEEIKNRLIETEDNLKNHFILKAGKEYYQIFKIPIKSENGNKMFFLYTQPQNESWDMKTAGKTVDHQAHEIKTQLSTLTMAIKNLEYVTEKSDYPPFITNELNDFLKTSLEAVNRITKLTEGLITAFFNEAVPKEELYLEDILYKFNSIKLTESSKVTILQPGTTRKKIIVNKRAVLVVFDLLIEMLSRYSTGIIIAQKVKDEDNCDLQMRLNNYTGPDLGYLCDGTDVLNKDLLIIRRLLSINNIICEQQLQVKTLILNFTFNR
ncbi:MAG: hypothetical protein JXR46_10200 [Calditrichaceae bacterium]|nr:hypothetical protein [Calditrichaceae bacterium]MBN2709405.1 hypothetical protein [Calditrichaceae bacterium]RQV94439.1 MAG: hypothetical protein EH224_10410 [Calditrichota bacterium]